MGRDTGWTGLVAVREGSAHPVRRPALDFRTRCVDMPYLVVLRDAPNRELRPLDGRRLVLEDVTRGPQFLLGRLSQADTQ